jgi:hypothetical protein
LTPEEREARRKERSRFSFSSAAYKHYDPRVEGYGSADEWIAAAEAIAAGCTILTTNTSRGVNPDLLTLNLTDWPATIAALKTAFRNSLFIYHPDHGGTNEQTIEALKAFERLSKFYKR